MSKEKNGGAAFPGFDYYRSKPLPVESQGMALRDYMAALAMQASIPYMGNIGVGQDANNMRLATASYAVADAMLRAREVS